MNIRKVNIALTFEEFMEKHELTLVIEYEHGQYYYEIEHPNGTLCQMRCQSANYLMGISKMARLISGKELHFCGKSIIVPELA